ncbi:mannose-6-phosphate isomerase, class I [Streptomyces nitrosporeus]|uniref:mannose-6-phosphate isomerase n=1 Tax=Streptomyces nitrosporeus TaxID=28894 RepID=A0A5J6F5F3_9ACTN|nr:mannose-6-phosphate isomerase, class I [Streptomyces nitrosporeus]QEU71246.1 mannose-6-phosphate isomerase, class I [Streptomyces nitrosporeus]GGY99510.1 mannose-6-phosphate isomerase, class I [Streptomyces nitrosporeus]
MDRLVTTVRPYAWGSTTALPRLTGTPPDGTPQAELWMGAHPAAPSQVRRGSGLRPLDAVIADDPAGELGEAALRRFGPRLPFLLKLLAADAPLSLQVHPDLAQAAAGFRAENSEGTPLDAPHRNYRDDNHKPEMLVALTPFDGLCGFRPPARCADLLDTLDVPGLAPYTTLLRQGAEEPALRQAFSACLAAPGELVAAVAAAVAGKAAGNGPHRQTFTAYHAVAEAYPGDPGLLAALMLNLVRLEPGEGLFLGAGVPHAYLHGLGVEVMAASDNVLRCGLTSKHVDTGELLRVVRFVPAPVRILRPSADEGEGAYPAPVDDFRLSRIRPREGAPVRLEATAPQILVCTRGEIRLEGPAGTLALGPGASAYVPAGEHVTADGDGEAYRATAGTGAEGAGTSSPASVPAR